MSYINRNHARQTGTNRTTQVEISNVFWLSFPGRVNFPEVDRAGWFEIAEARAKLLPGQHGFLDQLALLNRDPPK